MSSEGGSGADEETGVTPVAVMESEDLLRDIKAEPMDSTMDCSESETNMDDLYSDSRDMQVNYLI